MQPAELSQNLLLKVKMDESTDELAQQIAKLNPNELATALNTQNHRLAFWLNLYNAFFQIKVKSKPALFKNKMKLFFGRHFQVAGQMMSLDDIEHNMLRKSTHKWSFGYIKKLFPSKFEKQLQVFELDNRVHFAMNCGAVSCPPIRFYTTDNVLSELDLATINFLEQESRFDEVTNTVEATSLFNWFRGDFGGRSGIKKFLLEFDRIPNTSVKLKFKKYNWEQQFENYS